MRSSNRTVRLAVVPAVFAALTLSACQDEAPSAAPPSPASPTGQQSGAGGESQPSEGGDAQPPATESAAPEPSQAPSSGGAGGGCKSTDLHKITRGSVAPKPLSAPQKVKKDYGDGEAEVSIGQPTVDTSGGDSFFPGDGYQVVIFPVTIKAVQGSYVISELHFGLTDGSDQPCKRDVLNDVVPKADEIPVDTLQQGDSKSGKVGFAIPAGAKLTDFSVVYAEDYSSGKADVAWKAG